MSKPYYKYDRSGTDLTDVFGSSVRAKKKIKTIEHLLAKDDLPADIRIEKERALKALKVDLKKRLFDLRTQKRAKKYHMVRFFERKKAIRKLKQAQNAFDEATDEGVKKTIKKARKVLKHCQIDVAYNIMYPKSLKYISLYPTGPSAAEVEDENVKKGMQITDSRRLEFKKKVEDLIDSEKLPFTFEDVLKGHSINVDNFKWSQETEEIDAATNDKNDDEEDDFFE
ncbi:hypothetical protein JCM33374_g948 [Metschnikowia sp. JCM 33374]|nr:hypothetical protein JCM33374_g948 [Metschnikowia sp. JCM 33374]